MLYIDKFLYNFFYGCWKGYGTQPTSTSMLEEWRHMLDKKGYTGAILMDVGRVFDTINHELLLTKLNIIWF